jgi:hypothetical protein
VRWIAAFYLFGWCPSCLDKRVSVEAGPTYTTPVKAQQESCLTCPKFVSQCIGKRAVLRGDQCNDVHETFQRPDGVRYVKEHTDCTPYYEMKGPCT